MTKMEVLALLKEAGAAGADAAKKYNEQQVVTPGMAMEKEFIQYENPLVAVNEVARWKYIDTYPCGLAWVTVNVYKGPKTREFIKTMKEMGFVLEDDGGKYSKEPLYSSYHLGYFRQEMDAHSVYSFCIPGFNQSMNIPTEYAKAFSAVLQKHGIHADWKNWID